MELCNWQLRGSWVDVHFEKLEHVNSSDDDSIVMVNITRDQSGQYNYSIENEVQTHLNAFSCRYYCTASNAEHKVFCWW